MRSLVLGNQRLESTLRITQPDHKGSPATPSTRRPGKRAWSIKMTRGCSICTSDTGEAAGGPCWFLPPLPWAGGCRGRPPSCHQHPSPQARAPSLPPFQEQTGVATQGRSQGREGGVRGPREGKEQGTAVGQLTPGQTPPCGAEPGDGGLGGWGGAYTHTAPSVLAAQCTRGRRGRQPGSTHASTIWEPLPGLRGPTEEAGLCPGAQSGSILISRGNV